MNLSISTESDDRNFHPVFLDELMVGEADSWGGEGEKYHVTFNSDFCELASHMQIREIFLHNIGAFSLGIDTIKYQSLKWISSDSSAWFQNNLTCSVTIVPDFLSWDNLVTLSDVIEQLELITEIESPYEKNILEDGLHLIFRFDANNDVESEYSRIFNLINNQCAKIFFNRNNRKDSVFKVFNFPPEIRSACEQYLIYFSQFLEDVGIEVTLEINSQLNNTYFTVIPDKPEEALLNIKSLLDVYLSLPQTNDLEISQLQNSDISVSQLVSNIFHLKSQLQLAQAIIQAKDASIKSLNFINYQKETSLNSTKLNEEKIVDGLITITEYEGKGFKLNLPELIRRMKRTFQR